MHAGTSWLSNERVELFHIKDLHLFSFISLWRYFNCGASSEHICGGKDNESDISHQRHNPANISVALTRSVVSSEG